MRGARTSQRPRCAIRGDYQPVANFNVGLYAQQAGLPLEGTLGLAGLYASLMSIIDSKRLPELTPAGRHYMTQGWLAGDRGDFDPPSQTQESDP